MAENLPNSEVISDCGLENFYPNERTTFVFWDLVKYQIPRAKLQPAVESNIRAALYKMGLYGCVIMRAYGEKKLDHLKDDLYEAGFYYKPNGEVALDVILYANTCAPTTRGNFMVIPRPDPDSELHRVLKCLQSRSHDLLLVKPPDDDDKAQDGLLLHSVESLVECTQALDGGKPIIRGRRMGDTPLIGSFSSLMSLLCRNSLMPSCQGSERDTFVFWDLVKYPIPSSACIKSAGENIAALQHIGVHGCVEILAYGDKKLNQSDLYKAGIMFIQGYCQMVWALNSFLHRGRQANIMLIPRPDPINGRLLNILRRLERNHHNVLLLKPPLDGRGLDYDDFNIFLHSVHSIVKCTQGLHGGKPIIGDRRRMEDFSERITHYNKDGATVGFFWDVEDFPFPDGLSPDEIYAKIVSAFREDDDVTPMSIWAYVDDKDVSWGGDFLKDKTWESSINFLPGGGDKSARLNRMLHDIHLWALDTRVHVAYVFVVSDKVKRHKEFSRRLKYMHGSDYKVFLVTPSGSGEPANGSEWPESHFGQTYSFAS
ncbi:unnamed protein product [Microthlaspi erraticum]|uniref:NYN domain-containing protein n=1 Tax=Microthlaspi erraticum TaxID=1685480 RepID=A0A6D2JEA3_9BRAS|nr:unnamed protein product [Microthlaspi erraticum]